MGIKGLAKLLSDEAPDVSFLEIVESNQTSLLITSSSSISFLFIPLDMETVSCFTLMIVLGSTVSLWKYCVLVDSYTNVHWRRVFFCNFCLPFTSAFERLNSNRFMAERSPLMLRWQYTNS